MLSLSKYDEVSKIQHPHSPGRAAPAPPTGWSGQESNKIPTKSPILKKTPVVKAVEIMIRRQNRLSKSGIIYGFMRCLSFAWCA
jgi:hypothetical protein